MTEDISAFGDLNQINLSVCKSPTGVSLACGPAAAVNSFVYLEHTYPGVYGQSLVLLSPPFTQGMGEVITGNDLGSAVFMGCSCASGTAWSNFYSGKTSYINLLASDTTAFSQQTVPTADYIASYLNSRADIEILMVPSSGGTGHYVTVTGITYDDMGFGQLMYIDPLDGMFHVADLEGYDSISGLSVRYVAPGGSIPQSLNIAFAATEAPVPEPGTLILTPLSLAVLAMWRRRRRSVTE